MTVHGPLIEGGALRPSVLYPTEWNASVHACGAGAAAELEACARRLPRTFVTTAWTHAWKA